MHLKQLSLSLIHTHTHTSWLLHIQSPGRVRPGLCKGPQPTSMVWMGNGIKGDPLQTTPLEPVEAPNEPCPVQARPCVLTGPGSTRTVLSRCNLPSKHRSHRRSPSLGRKQELWPAAGSPGPGCESCLPARQSAVASGKQALTPWVMNGDHNLSSQDEDETKGRQ